MAARAFWGLGPLGFRALGRGTKIPEEEGVNPGSLSTKNQGLELGAQGLGVS